jgi:hydroxymethylglutaryl-CoA synthase
VYHTPFAGIAFQAHRTLCNLSAPRKKAEVREDFERRVMPALRLARRLGSSYGASNYSGLAGVVLGAPELSAGDRIGFFAYGSGAIGEFYSGIVLPEAKDSVRAMGIDDQLDKRREVSVEEYEKLEKYRERHIESADFVPDFSMLDDWYESFYEGKGYLVLKQVKDFYRTYEWS